MAWHDQAPWKRKQEQLKARIARVREVLAAYDAGGLSEGKALSTIEEIAAGEADRVVRVANEKHNPEVQT